MKRTIAMLVGVILLALVACKDPRPQTVSVEEHTAITGWEFVTSAVVKSFSDCEEFSEEAEITTAVTSEYLRNLSWEQLVAKCKLFKSEEDSAIKWMIYALENPNNYQLPYEHISTVNGLIKCSDTEFYTIYNKLQTVVNVFNSSHDLQVKMYAHKVKDEERMVVQAMSTNNPVTSVGQIAFIKDMSFFYESSKDFGTGRCSSTTRIIDSCMVYNPVLPEDFQVFVNGVSYLSNTGEVISRIYKKPHEVRNGGVDIPIDMTKRFMLHICDGKKDIGWILPEGLMIAS